MLENETIYTSNKQADMDLKDWVITVLISNIPIVGFIMLIIWAVGDNTVESKKNWARAYLIVSVIMVLLSFVLILPMFFGIFGLLF